MDTFAISPEEFLVRSNADDLGVDPDLAARVAHAESGFDPSAVSPKGARGVMQLMPGTAKDLGVDPNDSSDNIRGGVAYFKQLLDRYGGDQAKAAAAYNAGPARVDSGEPLPKETKDYVAKVTAQPSDFSVSPEDYLKQFAVSPEDYLKQQTAAPAAPVPTPGSQQVIPGMEQLGGAPPGIPRPPTPAGLRNQATAVAPAPAVIAPPTPGQTTPPSATMPAVPGMGPLGGTPPSIAPTPTPPGLVQQQHQHIIGALGQFQPNAPATAPTPTREQQGYDPQFAGTVKKLWDGEYLRDKISGAIDPIVYKALPPDAQLAIEVAKVASGIVTPENAAVALGAGEAAGLLKLAANAPAITALVENSPQVAKLLDIFSKSAVPATFSAISQWHAVDSAKQSWKDYSAGNTDAAKQHAIDAVTSVVFAGMAAAGANAEATEAQKAYPPDQTTLPARPLRPVEQQLAEATGTPPLARSARPAVAPEQAAATAAGLRQSGQTLVAQAWDRLAKGTLADPIPVDINGQPHSIQPRGNGPDGRPFYQVLDPDGKPIYGGTGSAVQDFLNQRGAAPVGATPETPAAPPAAEVVKPVIPSQAPPQISDKRWAQMSNAEKEAWATAQAARAAKLAPAPQTETNAVPDKEVPEIAPGALIKVGRDTYNIDKIENGQVSGTAAGWTVEPHPFTYPLAQMEGIRAQAAAGNRGPTTYSDIMNAPEEAQTTEAQPEIKPGTEFQIGTRKYTVQKMGDEADPKITYTIEGATQKPVTLIKPLSLFRQIVASSASSTAPAEEKPPATPAVADESMSSSARRPGVSEPTAGVSAPAQSPASTPFNVTPEDYQARYDRAVQTVSADHPEWPQSQVQSAAHNWAASGTLTGAPTQTIEKDSSAAGVALDPRYQEMVDAVTEAGKASTSTLQRKFRVGYGAASQILDQMEKDGIVGPADGSKPRPVLTPSPALDNVTQGEVQGNPDSRVQQSAVQEGVVHTPQTEAPGGPIARVNAESAPTAPANPAQEQNETTSQVETPVYKFSSTQVNLPEDIATKARAWTKRIPDIALAEEGREAESHVTLKYGLHDDDPAGVIQALEGEGPVKVRLGAISLFKGKTPEDPDVLKLDVTSPDLKRLNGKVSVLPHTDTHPKYLPHLTLAYVKRGAGDKYVGKIIPGVSGKTVQLDTVTFSANSGQRTDIPLTKVEEKPAVSAPTPTLPLAQEGPIPTGHFMNEGDIDQAIERFKDHPILSRATEFLRDLRDETDSHSDGWAYWKLPIHAAAQLQGMIQHPEYASEQNLMRAIAPIRSFYTRAGLKAGMEFPKVAGIQPMGGKAALTTKPAAPTKPAEAAERIKSLEGEAASLKDKQKEETMLIEGRSNALAKAIDAMHAVLSTNPKETDKHEIVAQALEKALKPAREFLEKLPDATEESRKTLSELIDFAQGQLGDLGKAPEPESQKARKPEINPDSRYADEDNPEALLEGARQQYAGHKNTEQNITDQLVNPKLTPKRRQALEDSLADARRMASATLAEISDAFGKETADQVRNATVPQLQGGTEPETPKPAVLKLGPEEPTEVIKPSKIKEPSNESDARAGENPEALAEVPSKDVSESGEQREAGEGAEERGRADEGSLRPSDRTGTSTGSGEGTDQGAVGVPAGREANAGTRSGQPSPERRLGSGTDYRITDADQIGAGSVKEKATQNLDAIRTLKQIEQDGRIATPDEQKILAKYSGWGGMPQAFKEDYAVPYEWKGIRADLDGLLTPEEFESARASTPNAHYTSPVVINAMWNAAERLGLLPKDGLVTVLEPSMGAGSFFGLMPEGTEATRTGIELDSITGRIAKLLYPQSDVHVAGFEKVRLPNDYFDLAISNVPFGNYPVFDPQYKRTPGVTRSIHDYFFAKALDKVRPGGVVAFITSNYTMDKKDPFMRQYLAQRADLIGAIRLPNSAFKASAGTEVTTDIIFLQKRAQEAAPSGEAWTQLKPVTGERKRPDGSMGPVEIEVNEYYAAHPEMMVGKMGLLGSMYRDETPALTGNLTPENLAEAVNRLPENIVTAWKAPQESFDSVSSIPATGELKDGGYTIQDGKILVRMGDQLRPTDLSSEQTRRVSGQIKVREAVYDVFRTQLAGDSDSGIAQAMKKLNTAYDAFVRNNGPLHKKENAKAFADDPDSPVLLALEDWDKETQKATKADIFNKRVIDTTKPATSADNARDALGLSLNEKGRLDWARMQELTGRTPAELQEELGPLVYQNPSGKAWEPADEYLSGNVRHKLADAEAAAAMDRKFQRNVEALKAVQPKELLPGEIKARLGSSWIPKQEIQKFVSELLDVPMRSVSVGHSEGLGSWTLSLTQKDTVANNRTWGTNRFRGSDLIDDALNLRSPTAYDASKDAHGNDIRVINDKETLAAREMQKQIKDKFSDWAWSEPDRATRLAQIYNEELNSDRLWQPDGSHLTFPGMNLGLKLRPHQKNGVWRIVRGDGNVLLAHVVGSGKTLEIVAGAMELRRLGKSKKPMVVVPNNRVGGTAEEWYRAYPSANILTIGGEDFTPEQRQETMARVATGNWDGVIVSTEAFTKVPVSDETFNSFLHEQIHEYEGFIREAKFDKSDTKIVKELEKAKKRMEAKIRTKNDDVRRDRAISFEDLGVDSLFVDEADQYKNLQFPSKMQRISGIPNTESQRAFDMYQKVQYLTRRNNGRGVIFATGTPVANSMAEVWTMQRYLQPQYLKDHGLQHFDSWAQTFGEVNPALEMTPDGTGVRVTNKFNKFVNMPELIKGFHQVADVQTAKMLQLPVPKLKGGRPTIVSAKASPAQEAYLKHLAERAKKVKGKKPTKGADNILVIGTDGQKAAVDIRLVDPSQPDHPTSKVNMAVDRIADTWEKTAAKKSTQIVFLDMSTPQPKRRGQVAVGFSVYEDMRDKLIRRGIPKNEIAFIQDYKDQTAKEDLFQAMQAGKVRILFGSTMAAGVGVNVQRKLIAQHQLDAPYRPRDVEQREGRILRQGNENPEVEIIRYVTEPSFDARKWDILQGKASYINAFMEGDMTVREMEDISDAELSYGEIAAIASGNPAIREKVVVDTEIRKLDAMRSRYEQQEYAIKRDLQALPGSIKSDHIEQKKAQKDIETRDAAPNEFTIGKKTFKGEDARKNAGVALEALLNTRFNEKGTDFGSQTFPIGSYRGFRLAGIDYTSTDGVRREADILIQGDLTYRSLNPDPATAIQSVEGKVRNIEAVRDNWARSAAESEKKLADTKKIAGQSFEQGDKLKALLARQAELEKLLQTKEPDASAVGGDQEGEGGEAETPADLAELKKQNLTSSLHGSDNGPISAYKPGRGNLKAPERAGGSVMEGWLTSEDEGRPIYSDGHMLLEGAAPGPVTNTAEATAKGMRDYLHPETAPTPVVPVAYGAPIEKGGAKTIWFNDETAVDSKYYDHVLKQYPSATLAVGQVKDRSVIYVQLNGRNIGIVMPLAFPKGAPAAVKPFLSPVPKEDAQQEARDRAEKGDGEVPRFSRISFPNRYSKGVLWVDRETMGTILRVVDANFRPGVTAAGVYLAPEQVQKLRAAIRGPVDEAIAEALKQTSPIIVVRRDPGDSIQTSIQRARHELFHASEEWSGSGGRGRELLKDPVVKRAVETLGRLGYPSDDPAVMFSEIGAHLSEGPNGWDRMGITREEVKSLWSKYLALLPDAVVNQLNRIAPQLKEELYAERATRSAEPSLGLDRKGSRENATPEEGPERGPIRRGIQPSLSRERGNTDEADTRLRREHGTNSPGAGELGELAEEPGSERRGGPSEEPGSDLSGYRPEEGELSRRSRPAGNKSKVPANTYEADARLTKSVALAEALDSVDAKAADVRSLSDEQWKMAADLATARAREKDPDAQQVYAPHSDDTKKEVASHLKLIHGIRANAEHGGAAVDLLTFGVRSTPKALGTVAAVPDLQALGAKSNAVEALQSALEDESDKNFGEKLRTFVTGERDIRIAATNQLRDKLKKLIPNPVQQEALSLMRDFKHKEDELLDFFTGEHEIFENQEHKLFEDMESGPGKEAYGRMRKLAPAVEAALNPTPQMLEADRELTKYFTEHLEEGRKLGFLDSSISNDEYITHLLQPAELSQKPSIKDRIFRSGKLGPRKFKFAKGRFYPTVLHAVASGLGLRTLNALDALTIYGDKYATTAAYHLFLRAVKDSGAGKWGTYSQQKAGKIPADWTELAPESRIFRNEVPFLTPEGDPQVAHQNLFVPSKLEEAMRPIFDPNYMSRVPGFQKGRMYQAYIKAVELGLSVFHLKALNLTALGNEGLSGLVGTYISDMNSPEFLDAEKSWVRAGLTTPILGRAVEAYQALKPSSLPTLAERIRSAPGLKQIDQAAAAITHLTFGIVQRKLKVTDASLKYARWIERHPTATPAEAFEAQRVISKEINAVYGGLHWENLGVNRVTQELARALMLAPDWTFSNIFNVGQSFTGGPGGNAARLFWIRSIILGLALTLGLSLLLSGKRSKDPTRVRLGRDQKGKELDDNVFFVGAPGDVSTLIHDVQKYGVIVGLVRVIGNKLGPVARAGVHLTTNTDQMGRPIIPKRTNTNLLGQRTRSHEPGFWEKTGLGAEELARDAAPVPFSVSTLARMILDKQHKYTMGQYAESVISGRQPSAVATRAP